VSLIPQTRATRPTSAIASRWDRQPDPNRRWAFVESTSGRPSTASKTGIGHSCQHAHELRKAAHIAGGEPPAGDLRRSGVAVGASTQQRPACPTQEFSPLLVCGDRRQHNSTAASTRKRNPAFFVRRPARLGRSAALGHRALGLLGGHDCDRQPELLHAVGQVSAQPV
jgi:hypothetical protein